MRDPRHLGRRRGSETTTTSQSLPSTLPAAQDQNFPAGCPCGCRSKPDYIDDPDCARHRHGRANHQCDKCRSLSLPALAAAEDCVGHCWFDEEAAADG